MDLRNVTQRAILLLLLLLPSYSALHALPAATTAQTLKVGAERALTSPSAAAAVARAGDTIEIGFDPSKASLFDKQTEDRL